MPYKDPERKRQWEREHREHRNAQRKNRRESVRRDSNSGKPSSEEKWGSPWGIIFGCATAFGVLLLASLGRRKG